MQRTLVLLCAVALTNVAAEPSRWSVLSNTELHGTVTLSPECGSLQHFLTGTSKRRELGTIKNRRTVQLLQKTGSDDVKRLLVERKKDEFCLIFLQQYQPGVVTIGSAEIYTVDGESILATRDRASGTGAFFVEAYWTFDEHGPIRLDIEIIQRELADLLPKENGIAKGYGLDLKSRCYRMPVWKKSDANCCPSGGAVALKLAIREHRLIVVSKKFDPNGAVEPRNTSCEP